MLGDVSLSVAGDSTQAGCLGCHDPSSAFRYHSPPSRQGFPEGLHLV